MTATMTKETTEQELRTQIAALDRKIASQAIFAGGMILLAVIVVLFILWHKSQQQKLVAQINSDRTRQDIKL